MDAPRIQSHPLNHARVAWPKDLVTKRECAFYYYYYYYYYCEGFHYVISLMCVCVCLCVCVCVLFLLASSSMDRRLVCGRETPGVKTLLLLCGAELGGVDAGRGFRAEMSAPLEVLRCWGLTACMTADGRGLRGRHPLKSSVQRDSSARLVAAGGRGLRVQHPLKMLDGVDDDRSTRWLSRGWCAVRGADEAD